MSEWAYRKCECGERVHMNFKCECGGDPWKISEQASIEIKELIEEKANLKSQIMGLTKRIYYLRKKL